jgi:3-oxoadipate enol-lactonase
MKTSVNGAELYYEDTGKPTGVPIVLIHGFPFSHEMWRPQVEPLQDRFRVIAYDVRGHGRSEVGDGQYTIELFVDDLIGLLDHLKVEEAVLCGLSMSGYIALRAVERNPERCRVLILCDTSSEADTNEAKLRRAASMRTVKRDGVKAYAEAFVKAVFAPESLAEKPEIVAMIRAIIESNSALAIFGTLLALAGRTETTSSLPKFEVPTLILVGELDKLTPPSLSMKMRDNLRNAELHVIPGAAHMSNLENPEEFNGRLLSFLDKQIPSNLRPA